VELYEAIEKRRTIRAFNAPATEEQLKKIVLAGTKAPNGRNTQPWEFIHVEDADLAGEIAQIKYDITMNMAKDNPDAEKMASKQKDSFNNASVLAVCSHPMGEASTWLAVENISLAAVAEGLGTSIAFYMGEPKAKVEKLLGLPEGYGLTCILKVGVPGEEGFDRNNSPYGPRRPEYSWLHKNKYETK
jgi:nitroreductase